MRTVAKLKRAPGRTGDHVGSADAINVIPHSTPPKTKAFNSPQSRSKPTATLGLAAGVMSDI